MRTTGRAVFLSLSLAPILAHAGEPTIVDVWPAAAPGEPSGIGAEAVQDPQPGQREVQRITNVTKPTLAIFRPEPSEATGAAVLIAPGGGYNILAYDLEGEEVARWLNTLGVTGIVLKYRVPRRPGTPRDEPPKEAFQDAQRALSLVRSRAAEWGIDPERIGMLGFSAGGHLTAWTATNPDRRSYEPIDAVDEASCRPDFAVLVYPAYLVESGTLDLRPDIRVSAESPPAFFVHAADDRLSADNSIGMYRALRAADVPAELHVYAKGGHGFGLRPSDDPVSTWPDRCASWLRSQGWLVSDER